ncbi:Uncharacterised protein [Mycobacteroides abscessus subsp. abscessus]|nr:Uncharacterised protein [Mycobacteroides abscessus subsp. abscessus]
MSKIVSSVIGSAGAGDPFRPGSSGSLRHPKAWRKTILPACPISTTAPGSRGAATASFTSVVMGAKGPVGTMLGAVIGCAGRPHEGVPARASRTVATAHTRVACDPGTFTTPTVVQRRRHSSQWRQPACIQFVIEFQDIHNIREVVIQHKKVKVGARNNRADKNCLIAESLLPA